MNSPPKSFRSGLKNTNEPQKATPQQNMQSCGVGRKNHMVETCLGTAASVKTSND